MKTVVCVGSVLFALAAGVAQAQEGDKDKYVTKEEYDKLKKDMEALKAKMDELLKKGGGNQETQEQLDELEKQLKETKAKLKEVKSGETKFLLTGYGFAGFTQKQGDNSTFDAGFNPIFLWMPGDKWLFEAELAVELQSAGSPGFAGDTHVGLEYAELSYILCDYATISAGRFLAPMGSFNKERHPKWINKLPDKPLAFDDGGITPEGLLGFEVHGGFPLGPTKLTYDVFVANGPRLETQDTVNSGILFDNNFHDTKHNKALGGRIGFLPIPELEIGYSALAGQVGPSGTTFVGVKAVIHVFDLTYVRESDWLKGTITLLAEWAWSKVDDATFDPDGSLGFGPVNFQNKRHGGYIQLSYRPSKVDNDIIKKFEVVVRYDGLFVPAGAPMNVDEQRWTLGLDYWITPSAVVKVAVQSDKKKDPANLAQDQNAFMVQFAIGF